MIKRILVILFVALFVSGAALAETDDQLPENWLDELLKEEPAAEEDAAVETDEVVADESVGAEEEEVLGADFVPALLTVEIRKQHPYACQYWLKLTNRLPFKIRSLALRFSAYIKSEDYDEPVLFETLTRSFSELRPTDEKFLDLFYMNIPCEGIDFIKVSDTGHCAAGELTKFTAQAGDCARYVEVEQSDMVTIFKVAGDDVEEPGSGKREQMFTLVKQEDVDRLVARFIHGYEAGDIEKFVALFDANVQTDDGVGRKHIRQRFRLICIAAVKILINAQHLK